MLKDAFYILSGTFLMIGNDNIVDLMVLIGINGQEGHFIEHYKSVFSGFADHFFESADIFDMFIL